MRQESKILIIGASSFFGSKLYSVLSKNYEIAGTYMSNHRDGCIPLNITKSEDTDALLDNARPDVVIHTAAISDPDECERDKKRAWNINVIGTTNIVKTCFKHNIRLVYISTDYVFKGDKLGGYSEEDAPEPVNYYGRTKFEGEQIVSTLADSLIIRLPIFYGYNDENDRPTFVTETVEALRNGYELILDDIQIRYPTLIDDIAEILNQLISMNAKGIYHISSSGPITKYKWALKIATVYGFPKEKVKRGEKSKDIAERPLNSKLNTKKLEQLGLPKPVDIEKGLQIMKKQKGCIFRMIYSVRPDKLVLNQSASQFRIELGKRLADEYPTEADIVVGVPESGIYSATGFSTRSGIPFYFGLIRDYYTQRTLFERVPKRRDIELRNKLIVVPDVIKNKRVVLIDEAIISGATLKVAIEKLKMNGVKEIHIRIPAPMMLSQCRYRILDGKAYLVARDFLKGDDTEAEKENVEAELTKYFQVNSLHFLSKKGFVSILRASAYYCIDCFELQGGLPK